MSKKVELKINTRIEINHEGKYYKSVIQDVTDKYIAIEIPTNYGVYIPLAEYDKVDVIYYSMDSQDIYGFSSVIIGRKVDKIPLILLSIPDSLSIVQRRKYVRVALIKYVKCLRVNKDLTISGIKKFLDENKNVYKADLVDLSGGGLRLKLNQKFEIDDIIAVSVEIADQDVIVKGRVVRKTDDLSGKYVYGVDFIDLDDSSRDKIIRYIFTIMRRSIQNGTNEV